MTIEEKAKAYDEAIDKIKYVMEHGVSPTLNKEDLQDIFPELKESKDEKIKKDVMEWFEEFPDEIWRGHYKKDIIAWLEKQGTSYTKKDVDDVYLKGVTDIKKELEKQYEETYQIRKDIAAFIFNYRGDIKDRAKWMDYLGIKVSFVEKQGEQTEIYKGRNYRCIKTHNYAGVEWREGIKYYANEDFELVNEGCTYYCPKYSKEEHNKLFEEVGKIGCVEKQGKKEYIDPDTIIQQRVDALADIVAEQKPANKVEPKFHDGEWITHNTANFVFKIINVGSNGYEVANRENYKKTISFDNEDNYHLWTIQDAKDGDVLAVEPIEGYSSSFVAICKKQNEEDFDSYCFVGFDGKFYESECGHSTENIHPATKEQRDLLFQKMKEAGLEWDAENKELKSVK